MKKKRNVRKKRNVLNKRKPRRKDCDWKPKLRPNVNELLKKRDVRKRKLKKSG